MLPDPAARAASVGVGDGGEAGGAGGPVGRGVHPVAPSDEVKVPASPGREAARPSD